jgi:hypothetical protein
MKKYCAPDHSLSLLRPASTPHSKQNIPVEFAALSLGILTPKVNQLIRGINIDGRFKENEKVVRT